MPYFKCVPCKIRVSAAGAGTNLTDGSCPGCGRSLEPVAKLTEVLAFRSPFDASVPPGVAERVSDITGGRAAAQAQLDADQWLLAEAVALEIPPPS